MSTISKVENKKVRVIGAIVLTIFFILITGYYIINLKYTPDEVRPAIKIAKDQLTEPDKQRQIELNNVFYIKNGREQGILDAQCKHWWCAFNLELGIKRGKIFKPQDKLKINKHSLSKIEKMYYNSGYINGYQEICAKYRTDCTKKINQMLSDYSRYYQSPIFDANEENYLTLTRDVKTKTEEGRAYYSIDNGEYVVIDTDKMVGNNNLPIRENVIERAEVSTNKKFIVLEVGKNIPGDNLYLYYLVFDIDNKILHQVNINPFTYEFVNIKWTPDNYLSIQKYGDTPTGRDVVAEYISTDIQKPWEVLPTTSHY